MPFIGATRETGLWRSPKSRRKLLWRDHDPLFIALGRWRLRIMKPGR